MNRMTLKHDLWLADARVTEGEANVGKQRALIAELEEGGHNTASAKDSLAELETLLRRHEAERDRSRKELDELT